VNHNFLLKWYFLHHGQIGIGIENEENSLITKSNKTRTVCEREREEASSLKRDNMTREIAFFMPS
jgi:hypothetical protein